MSKRLWLKRLISCENLENTMGWELSLQNTSPWTNGHWSQIVSYDTTITLKDVNSKYFTMNIGFRHFLNCVNRNLRPFWVLGVGQKLTSKLRFVLRHLSGSTMILTIGNYHSIIYQGANIKVKNVNHKYFSINFSFRHVFKYSINANWSVFQLGWRDIKILLTLHLFDKL